MKKHVIISICVIGLLLGLAETVKAESLFNIQSSHDMAASLRFNEDVTISFNYKTDEPGGVRIFVRPFTGSSATPNYAASGSPLYPTGSGAGTATFTVMSGANVVNRLRFRMYNADQSRVLMEFFMPVGFIFSEHSVYRIRVSPLGPSISTFGEEMKITFAYATTEAGGVRIFVRPFTGGSLTPNYAASGSPLYPMGVGAGSSDFTITLGSTVVDHLRIRMTNADDSRLLLEFFIPVYCGFAGAP
jgi:hypothetical protein